VAAPAARPELPAVVEVLALVVEPSSNKQKQ
jgi:hypothetical protein